MFVTMSKFFCKHTKNKKHNLKKNLKYQRIRPSCCKDLVTSKKDLWSLHASFTWKPWNVYKTRWTFSFSVISALGNPGFYFSKIDYTHFSPVDQINFSP